VKVGLESNQMPSSVDFPIPVASTPMPLLAASCMVESSDGAASVAHGMETGAQSRLRAWHGQTAGVIGWYHAVCVAADRARVGHQHPVLPGPGPGACGCRHLKSTWLQHACFPYEVYGLMLGMHLASCSMISMMQHVCLASCSGVQGILGNFVTLEMSVSHGPAGTMACQLRTCRPLLHPCGCGIVCGWGRWQWHVAALPDWCMHAAPVAYTEEGHVLAPHPRRCHTAGCASVLHAAATQHACSLVAPLRSVKCVLWSAVSTRRRRSRGTARCARARGSWWGARGSVCVHMHHRS
jgi:hypothetical protein